MNFETIDLLTGGVFQVTWDLGRRCNYDCSYCPAIRHDNFSPHASLNDLKRNVDFLFEYIDLYMQHRYFKRASIGFTGGEPTVNPNFIEFVKYLKSTYQEKYSHRWDCQFSLTSNGAMGKKMADNIIGNMKHITISYHTEASDKIKQQVKDRIIQFKQAQDLQSGPDGFSLSCNVMFHAAYFEECKELCDWLHDLGVKYVPRIIGEEPGSRSDFAHKYTEEQVDYMKNYWKYKNESLNNEKEVSNRLSATGEPENEKNKVEKHVPKNEKDKKEGWSIGRPCCGSRQMCLSNSNQSEKSWFVNNREFKDWHCSVNWFFLHIEQQTDRVFHHQTCQAKFDGTRGHIGRMGRGGADKILSDLKQQLESKTMPVIQCPRKVCGCGLCSPKSKHKDSFLDVAKNHIDIKVLDS